MNKKQYRKHYVLEGTSSQRVKDWMRSNPSKFKHLSGTPTSEQIGTILLKEGYRKVEDPLRVNYIK
jgi:hypothetical protein